MIAERTEISEFSRPVDLARLGDEENVIEIEASDAERTGLAARFGVIAIDALRAKLALRRIRGGAGLRLSGRLMADVRQACVVTLEPVSQHIEEDFEVLYAGDATHEESAIGPESDIAWPEPLPHGPLDVGEAVAQQLSLALDPYPRAPGAEVKGEWGGEGGKVKVKPFAALDKLRRGPRSSG